MKLSFRFIPSLIIASVASLISPPILGTELTSDPLQSFVSARKTFIDALTRRSGPPDESHWRELHNKLEAFQNSYRQLPRTGLDAERLYAAQFDLRFVNLKLRRFLQKWQTHGQISIATQQSFENHAHLLGSQNQTEYVAPRKTLPIEGVRGSDWPLARWAKQKEFYRYQFEGDELLFRGFRLRSGDVILNHPMEKPGGLFTALFEERGLYAHSAVLVFLRGPWGRLPAVIDVHERGVRAVPLHSYFDSKVLSFGEIYRWRNRPADFESRLPSAVQKLMAVEHPYDLTGSEDRKALSCLEMVDYLWELADLEGIKLESLIKAPIFKNLLRFGKIEKALVPMPNDIVRDPRFEFVGAFDNGLDARALIVNEVYIDLFREAMVTRVAKENQDLYKIFTYVLISQMRSKRSLFGGFLLRATGFNRQNFPAGDPGVLSAVNAIEFFLGRAIDECLNPRLKSLKNSCYRELQRTLAEVDADNFNFSIHDLKKGKALRTAAAARLDGFYSMFE